ncbi:DUF397 domain-containing protein [Streptomyces sp. NPDC085596]|uniref:DUF397 domain-containing protein n=1 Tax=Streptomyces sp. NPDC085596 TaxID=3365731 RepID=UPI0037D865E5
MRDMTGLEWFKSSYSGNDGPECVEVALAPAHIHVRDSKTTDGPHLTVSTDTWTTFLSHAVPRV